MWPVECGRVSHRCVGMSLVGVWACPLWVGGHAPHGVCENFSRGQTLEVPE